MLRFDKFAFNPCTSRSEHARQQFLRSQQGDAVERKLMRAKRLKYRFNIAKCAEGPALIFPAQLEQQDHVSGLQHLEWSNARIRNDRLSERGRTDGQRGGSRRVADDNKRHRKPRNTRGMDVTRLKADNRSVFWFSAPWWMVTNGRTPN